MAGQQSIETLLNGVRDAYVEDQRAKGIRSSGKSAQSLKIRTDENSGVLTGAKYFYQQKYGRKPGRFPPIDDILDWIRAKGITPRDTKTTERQLAFLFARKIAESGTDIFEGKRPALAVEDKIKELLAVFAKNMAVEFRDKIITTLKQ
jgi:hypothetical protein